MAQEGVQSKASNYKSSIVAICLSKIFPGYSPGNKNVPFANWVRYNYHLQVKISRPYKFFLYISPNGTPFHPVTL